MMIPTRRFYVYRNVNGICFVFDRANADACVWSGSNVEAARRERDRLEALAACL